MTSTPQEDSQDWVSAIIAGFAAQLQNPGQPLTLVAHLQVHDGTQDRFEAAFATAIAATRDEAGMIAYDLNRDENRRTQYVVYERWRTLADLERHLRTPYIQTLIEETNAVLAAQPQFRVLIPAGGAR